MCLPRIRLGDSVELDGFYCKLLSLKVFPSKSCTLDVAVWLVSRFYMLCIVYPNSVPSQFTSLIICCHAHIVWRNCRSITQSNGFEYKQMVLAIFINIRLQCNDFHENCLGFDVRVSRRSWNESVASRCSLQIVSFLHWYLSRHVGKAIPDVSYMKTAKHNRKQNA